MIGDILNIVAREVSAYVDKEGNLPSGKKSVILHKPNKLNEKFSIPDNTISLSLLNIEEEKVAKKVTVARRTVIDGKVYKENPAININLQVIFIASFENDYISELNYISKILSFFQQRISFTDEDTKGLKDLGIDKLNFKLSTLSLEKQNTVWGLLGSKYMPSLVYKISMIVFQSEAKLLDTKLVKTVDIQMDYKDKS